MLGTKRGRSRRLCRHHPHQREVVRCCLSGCSSTSSHFPDDSRNTCFASLSTIFLCSATTISSAPAPPQTTPLNHTKTQATRYSTRGETWRSGFLVNTQKPKIKVLLHDLGFLSSLLFWNAGKARMCCPSLGGHIAGCVTSTRGAGDLSLVFLCCSWLYVGFAALRSLVSVNT